MSHDRHAADAGHDVVDGADAPLSDSTLLDLLDALGVNYHTMATCCDTRRVSRRMRRALVNFREVGGVAGNDGAGEVDAGERERLAGRVPMLEEENAGLRDLVAERERQLEQMAGRLAEAEARRQDADDGAEDERGGPGARDWRPPRRGPGMPGAGVVTLDALPDEAHAFGPAAPLVAQWRELVTPVVSPSAGLIGPRLPCAGGSWKP